MSKYINEQQWLGIIKRDNWYQLINDDYQRLQQLADESEQAVADEIKEEVYNFFETQLGLGNVALGEAGLAWDKARKPIDTIVIHHTKNKPGITWQRLDAMHLIRLYAQYYLNPDKSEEQIKGRPIFSGHFRETRQVFYAYHWLVRENGTAERLLADDKVGWQAGDWDINCRSVAICLDADLTDASPTPGALLAISNLIKDRYPQVSQRRIFGHREVNPGTRCPGEKFIGGWKDELVLSLDR